MLKIERLPSSLSPTAVMQALSSPNTFYLTRLIDPPYPKEQQSLAMAVGSAFDMYIKMKMIEDQFKEKEIFLKELKEGIEAHNVEAHQAGKKVLRNYIDGPYDIREFHDIEVHHTIKIEGVPIFGKLDATSYDIAKGNFNFNSKTPISDIQSQEIIPFDWKVSGYTSKSGVSPKKYYYRIWEGLRPKPAHKEYIEDIPFEMIDEKWALQLCTYGWMIGKEVGVPFPARIDMACWRKGTVRIAQYRGIISREFQLSVLQEYIDVWTAINNGSFIERLASTNDINLVFIASLWEAESWWS